MVGILIPEFCVVYAEKYAHFHFLEGFAYGFCTAVIIALLIGLVKMYLDSKFKEITEKKK